MLDLFAGTRSIARAFEARGHETYSIEWDEQHENIDWYADISKITAQDIIDRFGYPDVIWGSFDCTTYSVAGISHHRRKEESGNLRPISESAIFADNMHSHVVELIKELKPKYYFIENPRGGLRKMDFMQGLPRHTTTYCQWGFEYMKATDLFTNHPNPNFKPPCKNGSSCHVAAPRGSRTGLQGVKGTVDRSRVPDELCNHIVSICEED